MSQLIFTQESVTPTPPASGLIAMYTLSGIVYIQNSVGTVTAIGVANGITALTGDVTATGPGSVAATVNFVGGQSASNIAAATVLVETATSSSVANSLVERDGAQNFSANVITATLNGNAATSSSSVTSISFTGPLAGDVTGHQSATVVSYVGGQTASAVAGATLSVDAATSLNTPGTLVDRDGTGSFAAGTITATFVGGLTGNVTGNVSGSSATFTSPLSGDVTGNQGSTVVQKIQGFAVNSTAPTDAQILVYNTTSNQWAPVSMSGDVSITHSGAASIASATVTGKLLTGYVVGSNTPILATDSILAAFEKVQGQLNATSSAAITALTGDGTATGPGSVVFTLATVNSNVGSFGNQTTVATFTVNAKGLITAASNVTIGNLTNSNLSGSAGITGANIASSTISNTNLAQMAANTVKANTGGVPANPVDTALGTVSEATSSVLVLTGWADATIGAPTIQVLQSSTSQSGYLSSTDWNTFNNKQTAGAYITALTGDVTAAGPGSAATTVAKIQGTTVAGTTGTGDVVFNNAPTFAGSINMSGNSVTSLATPVNPNDAVTKNYVDFTAQGIYPQNPIMIANLIDDSLSTPPVSPINFTTTYLIGSSPTGAWTSIGAGRFVYYDGTMWHDALGRAVQVGDRIGIDFSGLGTLGGNMVGEQYAIATVTNATPGSYAYTFATPANRWLVLDNNPLSFDAGNTYYFTGTSWVQVAVGFVTNPGIGLSASGVTWNVNYDNITIGINGSNQLHIMNSGVGTTQIANSAVTYAKIQNETASTLLGNPTGSATTPSEITLGATLAFSGSALQTSAISGDVTSSANSFATTVVAIQGHSVSSAAPTDAQMLLWNNGTSKWTPVSMSGDATTTDTGIISLATVNASPGTFGSSTAIPTVIVNSKGLVTSVTTSAVVAPAGTLSGTTLNAAVVNSSLQNLGTQNANLNMGGFAVNNVSQIAIGQATAASGTAIDIVNTSGSTQRIVQTGYGGTVGTRNRYANGTLGSPTAATVGNILGFISAQGYGASTFPAASTGALNFIAAEIFTNASNHTYATINTTPAGSVTSAEAFRVDSAGVTLGPQSASTAIHTSNGGWIRTTKTITASYTVDTTTTDDVILCNQSGAITITLPTPTVGRTIVIKDRSGNAQNWPITLAPHASETIEGLSQNKNLYTNFGAWTLTVGTAGNWWFI